MASLEKSDVMDALTKKGYREESGAKDHHYFVYYHDGKKTLIKTTDSKSDTRIVERLATSANLLCPLAASMDSASFCQRRQLAQLRPTAENDSSIDPIRIRSIPNYLIERAICCQDLL